MIESTCNWYRLVDGLMAQGYTVHLENASAIQKYSGLKHVDGKHDAFRLAEMRREVHVDFMLKAAGTKVASWSQQRHSP